MAIVEWAVEHFASQHGGNLRSDSLELDEILNLLRVGMRRHVLGQRNGIALRLNLLEHPQYELQALQLCQPSFAPSRHFASLPAVQLPQPQQPVTLHWLVGI